MTEVLECRSHFCFFKKKRPELPDIPDRQRICSKTIIVLVQFVFYSQVAVRVIRDNKKSVQILGSSDRRVFNHAVSFADNFCGINLTPEDKIEFRFPPKCGDQISVKPPHIGLTEIF